VVGGKPAHTVFSSFERVDLHGYVRDFVERDREGALRDWMDADVGAMAHAERRIARLIQHWMVWLRCKCASAPIPALRIDCLVKRVAPGRAEVHTLELTELGFSMLSWADGPRAVFSAVLASMFDDIGARRRMAYMPTPSFPHPALPGLVSPSELTPPARRALHRPHRGGERAASWPRRLPRPWWRWWERRRGGSGHDEGQRVRGLRVV